MNRWGLLTIALTIIALGSTVMLVLIPAPKTPLETASSTPATSTAPAIVSYKDVLTVNLPIGPFGATTTLSGKARTWYFEATFPIEVQNASGTVVGRGLAQAQGDWMTNDFVPFVATITITTPPPSGSAGVVIFRKDNPSDIRINDDSFSIPIVFQ